MPCLLSLEDRSGQLLGAVGLRSAGSGPLFLERYLQQPAEQVIAAQRVTHAPQRTHWWRSATSRPPAPVQHGY